MYNTVNCNGEVNMLKKYNFVLFLLIFGFTNSAWSSDEVMIEHEFVDYFKRLSSTTHVPITLQISLKNVYGKGAGVEDQKEMSAAEFPDVVTKSFLISTSDALGSFLPILAEKYDLDIYELKATIWVNAEGHKEKVNGLTSLKVME